MKKRFWLAFVIAVLAGTGLHFLYDVCPVPLVGLFAPVNDERMGASESCSSGRRWRRPSS